MKGPGKTGRKAGFLTRRIDSTGHRVKSEGDPEDDGGRGALGVEDSIMDESGEEEDEVGGMLDGDEDDD